MMLRIILVLVACCSSYAEPVVNGPLGARLDDWLQRMEAFGLHGAVLVEKDGVVVLKKGYGLAERSSRRPITHETLFDIGSLAKQFTATAVLALQADGKLHVGDRIEEHLDGVPADKHGVTIHQLLTHTSGLPYQPGPGATLDLELLFEPGSRWSYSNPGYELLARIIEQTSGSNWGKFLDERLFEPAGMTRTCAVGQRPWRFEDVANAYTDDTDQGSLADWSLGEPGPGGVATCVGDLLLWERALRDGRVLPADLAELLFAEHARRGTMGYGYGWMLHETVRGSRVILHQGNFGGFNADYRRYVDEGLTLIFLSNHFVQGRSMRDAVVNRLSLIIHGDEVPKPPRRREFHMRRGLVRETYRLDGGETLEIRQVQGGMSVTAHGHEGMNLVFSPNADEQMIDFRDTCNERSSRFFRAVFDDDEPTARSLVAPALPFEGAWLSVRQLGRNMVSQHGAFTDAEVTGTALSGDGRSGRTFVKLRFERGETLAQLTWGRDGILHIARAEGLPSRRFLALEGGGFGAFDIFSGSGVSLELSESGAVFRDDDGVAVGQAACVTCG